MWLHVHPNHVAWSGTSILQEGGGGERKGTAAVCI